MLASQSGRTLIRNGKQGGLPSDIAIGPLHAACCEVVLDPALSAMRNRVDANRFHAEAVSIFSPRVDCETCGGKGKRFLMTCRDCKGRGYRR